MNANVGTWRQARGKFGRFLNAWGADSPWAELEYCFLRLHVFATKVGEEGACPTLFLPDGGVSPPHPQGLLWKFVKTISDKDSPFVDFGLIGHLAIELHGYFLTFGIRQTD